MGFQKKKKIGWELGFRLKYNRELGFEPPLHDPLGSVNPWLLCIVRAQVSLRGNCCLSWKPISVCDETVIGHIGIHNGSFSLKTGPL